MKLLTRAEEYVLLAIWKLQKDAYTLPIQQEILEISGEKWSLGTIYAPLERLEKREYITSVISESTPERGGRQRRIYTLTKEGKQALVKTREVHDQMWQGVPEYFPASINNREVKICRSFFNR